MTDLENEPRCAWYNKGLITLSYGEIPGRADFIARAQEHCPFEMELVPTDYEAVAEAINQGIDAHLEAVALAGPVGEIPGPFPKRRVTIQDAGSLHTLARRLSEIALAQWCSDDELPEGEPNEDPPAANLASSIMETAGYEWV